MNGMKKRLVVIVNDEMMQRLRELSQALGIPVSDVVRSLILEHLGSWEAMAAFLANNPDLLAVWQTRRVLPSEADERLRKAIWPEG
ncbi:MAG: ribbon-helix-helix domain-containing protein [Thermoproteota archaeon]